MLPLVEEMGFGVDLLLFEGEGAAQAPAGHDPSAGGTRRVDRFRTPEELAVLLRAAEAPAFFSELSFDRRLSRSGEGRFSLAELAMGLPGALRTLERLLAVCRTTFYGRYASYLDRHEATRGAP